MGRKQTVTRTETTLDDAGAPEVARDDELDVALFADVGGKEDEKIEKIHVIRDDPDEGYLGHLEPTATELDVFQRWGGARYVIQAKNARGRIVQRRTLKLAGDPVFQSEIAEIRWRRANGLGPKKEGSKEVPGESMGARELIALVKETAEQTKRETEERLERMRKEDLEREEAKRREEREFRAEQERQRREHEERMRKEDADREERKRKEERDYQERKEAQRREDERRAEEQRRADDARRDADHKRAIENQQQFFTNMLAMAKTSEKSGGDTTTALVKGIELAMALKGDGGEGPQEPLQLLLSRLPETLGAAKDLVVQGVREAKGMGGGETGGGEADDGSIKLSGEVAAKTRALVTSLIQKGHDPQRILSGAMDHLMRLPPKGQAGPSATPAAKRPRAPKPTPTAQPAPQGEVTEAASDKPPGAP